MKSIHTAQQEGSNDKEKIMAISRATLDQIAHTTPDDINPGELKVLIGGDVTHNVSEYTKSTYLENYRPNYIDRSETKIS